MLNIKEDLLAMVEKFVKAEYTPTPAGGPVFFGCMDCSNSCAENCAIKCKKNGKR